MDVLSKTANLFFGKGLGRFNAWFLVPKSTDEDKRRSEHILNILLVSSIVMLSFFDGIVLYYSIREGSAYHEVPFAIFSIIPVFFLFLLALSRRGFPVATSYLLVVAYLASNSYAAYQWGVDLHVVVLSYALIVLIASILVGTWFGFTTAGIIAVIIVPLRYLQLSGIVTLQPREDQVADAVELALIFFLIMTVAWLWNRELEKSLTRARRSESELKEERDMLEVKVEERTQALRRAQYEKIEQLYQFAEFGQLASGLFHDLLNLVNAASLINDQQLRESQLDELASIQAKIPVGQASAMSRRVEGFMQAIKRQLDHKETEELFSLPEGVEYVMQLLSYKATKKKIRILFPQKGEHEPVYFGNVFKFHQVMMNLVSNAIDAYGGVTEDALNRIIEVNIQQKENILEISVRDNACGIPRGIHEKIFEPFFTTKGGSKGTGIGLATVKKFVEQDFQGKISVQSEEGKGSIFTIAFPSRDR